MVDEKTMVFSSSVRQGQVTETPDGDSGSFGQKSDCGDIREPASMVLPGVSGAKEERDMASRLRLVTAQQAPCHTQISHGVGSIDHEQPSQGGLGHQYRHQRCLSACPDTSKVPEVPTFRLPGQGVQVHGTTLWHSHCPVRLHPSGQGNGRGYSSGGGEISPLSGRLADCSRLPSASPSRSRVCAQTSDQSGMDPELGEIRSDTHTMSSTCGDRVRSGNGISFPASSPVGKARGCSATSIAGSFVHRSQSFVSDRLARVNGEAGSVRSVLPTATTVGLSSTVADLQGSSGRDSPDPSGDQGGPVLVAKQSQHQAGDTAGAFCSRPASFHRRLTDGLGGSSERVAGLQALEPGRPRAAYQRSRAQGGEICVRDALQPVWSWDKMAYILRQHDGCRARQQARGDKIQTPLLGSGDFVPPRMEERSHSPRKTHSGQEECVGRPVVKAHTSTRHGVEPMSSGVPEDQGGLLRPSDRLVRHLGEQQGSSVLLTAPREHSAGHGCDVTFVGRPVGVRLPANRLHSGGPLQGTEVQVRATPGSSGMAQAAMVSPATVHAGGRATLVAGQGQVAEAARHDILPPEPRDAPASRVEAVQRSFQEAGFSEEVSTHLSRRNRASTNAVYEAKWRVYSRWCVGRSFDPCSPTLNQVLEFFCHLFDALQLAPSSIEGYRAMLSPILSQTMGLDLSNLRVLSDLMASFRAQRPRVVPSLPEWDVTFVLYCLSKEPYEPLDGIIVKALNIQDLLFGFVGKWTT